MQFSNQAMGALMMALQKSLLTQTDIVPVLQSFNFETDENGHLVVTNPPVVRAAADSTSDSLSVFTEANETLVSSDS